MWTGTSGCRRTNGSWWPPSAGGRTIGRQLRRRPLVRNGLLGPARLVRRVHRRVEMMAANLPDALLFDVLVLEHAQAPVRVLAVHGFLRYEMKGLLFRSLGRYLTTGASGHLNRGGVS